MEVNFFDFFESGSVQCESRSIFFSPVFKIRKEIVSYLSISCTVMWLFNMQSQCDCRWKEECQTITQKFDTKISDLRSDLSRERKRTQELTSLLRDSKTKTADVGS